MSSSRKSVKDHLLKRDVARAEGGEISQYTIHLRQMGGKNHTNLLHNQTKQTTLHQTEKQAPLLELCSRLQPRSRVVTPALFPLQDPAPHGPKETDWGGTVWESAFSIPAERYHPPHTRLPAQLVPEAPTLQLTCR